MQAFIVLVTEADMVEVFASEEAAYEATSKYLDIDFEFRRYEVEAPTVMALKESLEKQYPDCQILLTRWLEEQLSKLESTKWFYVPS